MLLSLWGVQIWPPETKRHIKSSLEELIKLEIQASLYRKTKSPFEPNICIQLLRNGCRKKCSRQSRKLLWVVLKFETKVREARTCLRVLKESNKSRFDGYTASNSVLIISQISFRDCPVCIFFRQTFSK